MHEAIKRLASGQSVKAISFDLGFKQVSHFSRVFKSFYGAPPSCWLRAPLEGIIFRGQI
jgi:AraC-like DNA-binding protein